MESVDTIVMNNKEYIVIDDIPIDGVRYIYLVSSDDPRNFCIRKINIVNDSEYIVNLDTKEEFDKALAKFNEKNHE